MDKIARATDTLLSPAPYSPISQPQLEAQPTPWALNPMTWRPHKDPHETAYCLCGNTFPFSLGYTLYATITATDDDGTTTEHTDWITFCDLQCMTAISQAYGNG